MPRKRLLVLLVLWASLAAPPLVLADVASSTDALSLWLGTGRAEITPPVGTPLAGYRKRHGQPSTGVEAPLYARALALREGATTVVLVSAELLIIDEPLRRAVSDAVRQRLGLAPDHLVLAATHTHSGPGAYGQHALERLSMGGYDQRVFDRIARGITVAVEQAMQQLAPVAMGWSDVSVPNAVQNRRNPAGLVDDHARILAFRSREGTLRAVVVNFAAHPTTLGADNFILSGDYPGVVMRTLETQWPDSRCLCTVGNPGDQRPNVREKNAASMQAYGTQVAQAVIAAVSQMPWQTAPPLDVATQRVPLPTSHLRLGRLRLPGWLSQAFLQQSTAPVTVIRLGDVVLVGYPGEPTRAIGQRLTTRLRAAGATGMLIAFTNAYIGYVVSPDEYATRSYEAEMAFFGPDVADRLETAIVPLVEQMFHAARRP